MEYQENKLTIKAWNEDDRPREKLMLKGKASLSDAELMAIIIGSGSREDSAVELSKKILNAKENSLEELSRMNLDQLKQFKGIGEAKAISIIAALELGRRRQFINPKEKPKIACSKDAYLSIAHLIEDLNHEEFWILHLNYNLRLTKIEKISTGGLSATIVDPRIIGKSCLENLSTAIVLCHNHPSGNLMPSQADLNITQKLKSALLLFDIIVNDHIIIAGKEYYSFADDGKM